MTDTTTAAAGSDFDKLLSEIEGVHKALPAADKAGDEKIALAAAAGAVDKDGKPVAGAEGAAAPAEGDGKVAKSFEVVLEDGTKTEAFDATDLLKSLADDQASTKEQVFKAVSQLFDVVKAQGALIAELRKAPAGRRAVLNISEKPGPTGDPLNKGGNGDTISGKDFMAKADVAFKDGKISGHQLRVAELALNTGKQIPLEIVKSVMGM